MPEGGPVSGRCGRVVWKFTLRAWSIFIDVPRGAELLSVGAQRDDIVVWMLCDPDVLTVSRLVAAWPTGEPLPEAADGTRYVGTVQMDDGLVFHVFDGGEHA